MEKKDLEQIREVVKEEVVQGFKQAFTGVWEHNLEPAFTAVHDRIDQVSGRIDQVSGRIDQLPTKSYLDDKIAELKGDFTTKLRKQDEKINRIS